MYNTYFFTSTLSFYKFNKSVTVLYKDRKPYEFNDGSNDKVNTPVAESGKSKMNGSPSVSSSGVQINTNLDTSKAGSSRRNNRTPGNNSQSANSGSSNSNNQSNKKKTSNYTPLNLSSCLVSKKIVDKNLLLNPARFSSQENVDLKFTVKPINDLLNIQAITWASKIDTNHSIEKYKIFGNEKFQGEYLEKLQQIYIYSYYKCLLLGSNEYRIDQTSDSDHCLVGHCMLYQMIYKRNYSFEINGVFVNYMIYISDEDKINIIKSAKDYPYISSSIMSFSNRFNILNTTIERYIENLRFAISGSDLDVLFVRLSDATKLHSYTSSANLPLANSFWSADQKSWFYCYNEFSQINGNTLLFGKANFITNNGINQSVLSNFEFTKFSDDQNIIIKYEVSCVASSKYFDCKYNKEQRVPKN